MRQTVPALLPLFRSEQQLRLLGILLLAPDRAWTIDDLAAATGSPRASVHRELQRALDAGLINRDGTRRPHRFQAHESSAIYQPLRELLERTVGVEAELRKVLESIDGIDAALIYGSWARGESRADSDIDVLVVGHSDLTEVRRALRSAGKRLGRRIDVTALLPEEFEARRSAGDGYIQKLLAEPYVVVAGALE